MHSICNILKTQLHFEKSTPYAVHVRAELCLHMIKSGVMCLQLPLYPFKAVLQHFDNVIQRRFRLQPFLPGIHIPNHMTSICRQCEKRLCTICQTLYLFSISPAMLS